MSNTANAPAAFTLRPTSIEQLLMLIETESWPPSLAGHLMFHGMTGFPRAYMELRTGLNQCDLGLAGDEQLIARYMYSTFGWRAEGTIATVGQILLDAAWKLFQDVRRFATTAGPGVNTRPVYDADEVIPLFWRLRDKIQMEEHTDVETWSEATTKRRPKPVKKLVVTLRTRFVIPGVDLSSFAKIEGDPWPLLNTAAQPWSEAEQIQAQSLDRSKLEDNGLYVGLAQPR